MCLLFPGVTGEPTNYSHMPYTPEDQKFDHLCLQGLSFCGQKWTFDIGLVMQTKLEGKDICASDLLKPPIFALLTLIFYVLHSRFGFALQEAYF